MNVRIAARSVFRNKRRTVITLLSIIFGCVAIIVFGGFVDYSMWGLRESTIHSRLGHLQVYKAGYSEKGGTNPLAYTIEDYPRIKSIIEAQDHVDFVTSRLEFSGLIGGAENSVICLGKGVEPEKERELGVSVSIVEGKDLTSERLEEGIIGKGLAEGLGVKIDDYLTILTSTAEGALNAVDFKLRGIFRTGMKEYDDVAVMVPMELAKTLLYTENVQSIVVVLDETENTDLVADTLERKFSQANLDLEIKTWSDLATFYHQVVQLYGSIFWVVRFIILVIVIFSIANTMTMSVFERMREIGTIRAMGTRRRGVLSLFIMEGLILGALGGALGLAFGTIAAKLLSIKGIYIPAPPTMTEGYTALINVVPKDLIFAFSLAVGTALVSSIYPAFKAARLKVVDALRYI
ncbi:MAG: FtsX-like permease family protein [Candidatus Aerophobetes bacterium]